MKRIIKIFNFFLSVFIMGGVVAKLDSNDKVISMEVKGKDLTKENQEKIINYYNKSGILKVKINPKNIDALIDSYLKLFSKKDSKLESSLKENLKMTTGISLMMLSNFGFVMMLNSSKSIEGFDNIEQFSNVDSNPKLAVVRDPPPKVKEEPKDESMQVIIPKILLSQDRREFIDFISKIFATDDKTKVLYDGIKDSLDKIVSETNYEVRIANLISLIMRIMVVVSIISASEKLGPNNFSKDDESKFMTQVFFEVISLIPNDRCLFNEHNVFEFSPNICNVKPIKQENCPKCAVQPDLKCPECKKTECPKTECPKTECPKPQDLNCPDPKCPNTEESGLKNLLIIVLLIIAVISVIAYFTKQCPKNVRNLSRLN